MTDPLHYTSTTARYSLPFLFAGQAQKEFTVNQAHVLLDMLLHPAVEGERATPPADPETGQCWIVGEGATGQWEGRTGQLAGYQAGAWIYASPVAGMQVYDMFAAQHMVFRGTEWSRASRPVPPEGGSVVDVEARAAIASILKCLESTAAIPVT